MKKYYISLVIGAILAIASLAVATESNHQDASSSSSLIIAIGLIFNGATNIGSIVFFVKRYVSKVDKTDETLPVLVSTLESTRAAMDQHALGIEELYNTRNAHEIKLTKIEMLHEIRGCNHGVIINKEK